MSASDPPPAVRDDRDQGRFAVEQDGAVHDPARGQQVFAAVNGPIITAEGNRIAGLRFADPRVHALLCALLVFRLGPNGFTNRDLRALVAQLLGKDLHALSAGQLTYDLRRLRAHGLITRRAGTHRYQVTDTGCTTPCS